MPFRTNAKEFIGNEFPELSDYKIFTSRKYRADEKSSYKDDWWFNFKFEILENTEFIVFAGALDNQNKKFKLFKVPTQFIKDNIDKLYMDKNNWIIIYLHIKDYVDVRKDYNLSFKKFSVN